VVPRDAATAGQQFQQAVQGAMQQTGPTKSDRRFHGLA
jgi:hypothetical protein